MSSPRGDRDGAVLKRVVIRRETMRGVIIRGDRRRKLRRKVRREIKREARREKGG